MTSPLVGIACGLLLKGQNIANIVEGEPTTKEEFESSYREQIGTDGDMAIMSSDPSEWKLNWEQVKAKVDELSVTQPFEQLRIDRDNLLKETDWMANSDVTMSDAWKTYRQALRDLPANTSDPANPTWPTKPS
tara:strand:- start:130 stop:528 length:399 start_codon:yes stop_codon:yes gene_type:complete